MRRRRIGSMGVSSRWRPVLLVLGAWMAMADPAGLPPVRINEIVARPFGGGPDWLELINLGQEETSLVGWSLLDGSSGRRLYLGDTGCTGTTAIRPGQHLVIYQADRSSEVCKLPFGMSVNGDSITMFDHNGRVVDATEWGEGEAPEGASWARIPDGTGPFTTVWVPTPGLANTDGTFLAEEVVEEEPLEVCSAYMAPDDEPVFPRFVADITGPKDLVEISGVASTRRTTGALWVHEDGEEAFIYALGVEEDNAGRVLAAFAFDFEVEDLEDIATAKCPDGVTDCVWLADTGDNCARDAVEADKDEDDPPDCELRREHVVWAVEEPNLNFNRTVKNPIPFVTGELGRKTWRFSIFYEGGAYHDMESLMVKPDGSEFYLIERTRVCCPLLYASGDVSSRPPGFREAMVLFPTTILDRPQDRPISGADVHPSGKEFAITTPRHGTFLYSLSRPFDFTEVAGPWKVAKGAGVPQMEGVAYDFTEIYPGQEGKGLWLVSEAVEDDEEPPLLHLSCLQA